MIEIRRYTASDKNNWDSFVSTSKNGTFLFYRDFVEYHQERFQDYSLLVWKDDKIIGVFPANINNATVYSHQGLSYGGLVVNAQLKFKDYLEATYTLLQYLNEQGIEKVVLKQLPSIYERYLAGETDYLMFLLHAKCYRVDLSSTIALENSPKISRDRRGGYNRGKRFGLVVAESEDFDGFWNEILIPNLDTKHQTAPVHSLAEIKLLKLRFPNAIRLFTVNHEERLVAGTVIFETAQVAHSQYISGNADKNKLGSLDYLHIYLLENVFKHKKYFDFGISNESQGQNINEGLLYWKEGFGARSIAHKFYEIDVKEYGNLKTVFI